MQAFFFFFCHYLHLQFACKNHNISLSMFFVVGSGGVDSLMEQVKLYTVGVAIWNCYSYQPDIHRCKQLCLTLSSVCMHKRVIVVVLFTFQGLGMI